MINEILSSFPQYATPICSQQSAIFVFTCQPINAALLLAKTRQRLIAMLVKLEHPQLPTTSGQIKTVTPLLVEILVLVTCNWAITPGDGA